MNKVSIATGKMMDQFQVALNAGLDGLKNAAKILVNAIDNDPDALDRFKKRFRGSVPETAWRSLEAVGREKLHPKLMLGCVKNSGYIRRLPYHEQKKFLDDGATVELATKSGTMLAKPTDLKQEQADQVFNCGKIRTVKEQEEFAKAKGSVPKPIKRADYTIENGVVKLWHNRVFTEEELVDLLEELRAWKKANNV